MKSNAHGTKYDSFANFDHGSTNQKADEKDDVFERNAEIVKAFRGD